MTNKERKSNLIRVCQRYAKNMPEFGKFSLKRLRQGYTKATPKFGLFSLIHLLQLFSNTTPKNDPFKGKMLGQKLVRTWSVFTEPFRKNLSLLDITWLFLYVVLLKQLL